jgi:hypothetical protein
VPVAGSIDPVTGRLRATVSLHQAASAPSGAVAGSTAPPGAAQATAAGMVVLTLQSASKGSAGTYTATSVKASDAW